MAVVFANANEKALQLAPDEKRALIESAVIGLDCDPDANLGEVARAWDEEIARRFDAMDRGEVEMIDGDEVSARLRAILA